MNKEICFKINFNELFLEQVLVEYNKTPIYFVCKDDNEVYYIVLCVDIDEEKYIIIETKIENLVNLLKQKITMREIILIEKNYWEIVAGDTIEEDICIQRNMEAICVEDLPYENSYFKVVTKAHHDFLEQIRSLAFSQTEEWVNVNNSIISRSDELAVQINIENITVDDFIGFENVAVPNTIVVATNKIGEYNDDFEDMNTEQSTSKKIAFKKQSILSSENDTIAA